MGALRFLPLTAAKLVDFIIRHQTKKAAFFAQRYSAKKQLQALSRTAHWPPSLALLHLHSSYLSGLTVCLEITPPRPAAALPRLRSHARTCHCFRSYGPDHCPSKNPPDPAYLCVNSSHSSHGQSLFQTRTLHQRRCSLCVASLSPASLRFAQAFSTACLVPVNPPKPELSSKETAFQPTFVASFSRPNTFEGPILDHGARENR